MTQRSMLAVPPPTDPDDFDRKVMDALRARHRNVHLIRYARHGQAQGGIDGWDPIAGGGVRLVWQATLTKRPRLLSKLDHDLAAMDEAGIEPDLFILAVGLHRDRGIQDAVARRSEDRERQGSARIEILFWEEIRQFILDDDKLFAKHYDSLIPTTVVPQAGAVAPASSVPGIVAIEAIGICDDAKDIGRCLWQMRHLAWMCGSLSDEDLAALDASASARDAGVTRLGSYPNGTTACIGGNWYYPNGENACIGGNWHYPNGENACIGGNWFYPNGETACIGGNWYAPGGEISGDEGTLLAVCLQSVAHDHRRSVTAALSNLEGALRRFAIVQLAWQPYQEFG